MFMYFFINLLCCNAVSIFKSFKLSTMSITSFITESESFPDSNEPTSKSNLSTISSGDEKNPLPLWLRGGNPLSPRLRLTASLP